MTIYVSEQDKPLFSEQELTYMEDVIWVSEERFQKLTENNELLPMEVYDSGCEPTVDFNYLCVITD